jgi:hypothetical protein
LTIALLLLANGPVVFEQVSLVLLLDSFEKEQLKEQKLMKLELNRKMCLT